jgi:tetratricopeptide (TPR) repeat protein
VVLFRPPSPAPAARHRDLFRSPEAPKPEQPQAPAPKPQTNAPAPTRNEQLFKRYMAQGDVYMKSGQLGQDTFRKALIEYQRAIVAKPHSPSPHLSLAAAWTALKDYPRAAESLRKAAGLAKGGRMPEEDLARLRRMSDDTRIMLLKGWCKQNPDDRDARLLLGYHCLLADRAKEAQESFDELLATNPADTAAAYLVRQL